LHCEPSLLPFGRWPALLAVALAIMADAEHTIAAGLLAAYLSSDALYRVHAGVSYETVTLRKFTMGHQM